MTTWRERFPWTAAVTRVLWFDARRRRRSLVLLALAVLLVVVTHAVASGRSARRLSATAKEIASRRGALELKDAAGDSVVEGPPAVPSADNRAKALRAAAELLVLDDIPAGRGDLALVGRLTQFDDREPDEESWTRLAAILEQNRIVLELLDEAARRKAANWEIAYAEGFSAPVPPLLELVQLAKLNVGAARLELRRGDANAATALALRGFAMVESMSDEPILILQMIRGSILRLHLGLVREILARTELEVEQLAALSSTLERIEIRRPLERAIVWEMRAVRDVLLKEDLGELTGGERPWFGLAPARWMLRPVIHESARRYLVEMDRFASEAALPPVGRAAADSTSPAEVGWFSFLVQPALVEIDSVLDRSDVWDATRELARVALALERWQRAQGAYPDRLEELVPGTLHSLPLDPFTGDPPLYARSASGYVVSSAGTVEESAIPGYTRLMRWEKL